MATLGKGEKKIWLDNLYIYEAASEVLGAKIKLVKSEYDRVYKPYGYSSIQKISERIKDVDSIAGKLEKDGYEFSKENIDTHIHDVVGHRVVCLTLTDLAAFAKIFSESVYNTEAFTLLGYKDFISRPKPSGYRSLHLRLEVPVTFSNEHHDVVCEVQLRTSNMEAWAQIEHKSGYKPAFGSQEMLAQQLLAYSSMGDGVDKMVSSLMLPSGEIVTYSDVVNNIKQLVIDSNSDKDIEENENGIVAKQKKMTR